MLLYTMTEGFLRDTIIDGYSSAIWTERFFQSGDVEILCPLEKKFVDLLAPGTIVGHGSSREVAVIENHEIEEGLLKATGPMLDEVLFKNRMAWFENPETGEGASSTAEFKQTSLPGEMIAVVVTDTVISPSDFTTWGVADLDWVRDKIDNLTLGFISDGGLERPRTFPIGPLSEGLRSFATSQGMGFRIYLESATEADYSLIFSAWYGRDLTSRQEDNPLVRLSPNLNSLLDTKEVLSISEYKNVAYVYHDNVIYTYYAEPDLPIPEGLDRRVMVRDAPGDPPPGELTEYLAQHAYDAFANNNYIRAIDGQASIPSKYRYQVDYRLGDIIELEGVTGNLAKARVTEYIRAQDETGDHEYPTVSVIDPLDSGNWPEVDGPWGPDDPDPPWPPDPPDPPDPDPVDPHPRPYPRPKKKPKPYPPYDPDVDPPPPPPPPPPEDPDPVDPDDPDDWPGPPDPGSWIPIDVFEFAVAGETAEEYAYGEYSFTGELDAGVLQIPFTNNAYMITSIFEINVSMGDFWPHTPLFGWSAVRGDTDGAYAFIPIAEGGDWYPDQYFMSRSGNQATVVGLKNVVVSRGGGYPSVPYLDDGDWPVKFSAAIINGLTDDMVAAGPPYPDPVAPTWTGRCVTRLYMHFD